MRLPRIRHGQIQRMSVIRKPEPIHTHLSEYLMRPKYHRMEIQPIKHQPAVVQQFYMPVPAYTHLSTRQTRVKCGRIQRMPVY